MCKDEQKPELETCYEKKELRSYVHEKKSSGAMFMKRAPEPEQRYFYDGSAALLKSTCYMIFL